MGERLGGRQKGTKNRLTGAHGNLLTAWDKVGGLERAVMLLKRAFEEAEGHDVRIEKLNADGDVVEVIVKREYNFGPILGILPYIARKMPETFHVAAMQMVTDMSEEDKVRLAREFIESGAIDAEVVTKPGELPSEGSGAPPAALDEKA